MWPQTSYLAHVVQHIALFYQFTILFSATNTPLPIAVTEFSYDKCSAMHNACPYTIKGKYSGAWVIGPGLSPATNLELGILSPSPPLHRPTIVLSFDISRYVLWQHAEQLNRSVSLFSIVVCFIAPYFKNLHITSHNCGLKIIFHSSQACLLWMSIPTLSTPHLLLACLAMLYQRSLEASILLKGNSTVPPKLQHAPFWVIFLSLILYSVSLYK